MNETFIVGLWGVRYQVKDVQPAIAFYTQTLGIHLDMQNPEERCQAFRGGGWAVENEGVAPDIEVIDAPDALARGEDPALERGVKYLLDQLAKNPPKKVTVPPVPTGGNPR